MSADASSTPEHPPAPATVAAVWLVVAAGLAGVWWQQLLRLAEVWDHDANYSHGFVVPIVSLGFAWMAWQSVGPPLARRVGRGPVIGGGYLAIGGFLLHVASWYFDWLLADVVSLIVVLLGLLLMLGGSKALKGYAFATCFLIFMAPWPNVVYTPLAVWMQQLVSGASTWMVQALGLPAYREGFVIHVADHQLEVAQACSGLTALTAVLALSFAIGHVVRRGWWFTSILVVLAWPIAFASNCLRVIVMALVTYYWGPEWISGHWHDIQGLTTIALSAAMMLLAAWLAYDVQTRWHSRRATA